METPQEALYETVAEPGIETAGQSTGETCALPVAETRGRTTAQTTTETTAESNAETAAEPNSAAPVSASVETRVRAGGRTRPGVVNGVPAGNGKVRSPSGVKAKMIRNIQRQHSAGRQVSGAELDRRFGTVNYGSRILRELQAGTRT